MIVAQKLKTLLPEPLFSLLRNIYHTSRSSYFSKVAKLLSSHSSPETTGLTFLFESLPYDHTLVIKGYLLGIFPSSLKGDGMITWHDPDERGVLPIENFHVPSNIKRLLRQDRFDLKVDYDPLAVMEGCAYGRKKTHITSRYMEVYMKLHEMGLVHSVSAWQDNKIVGGTFGIALGAYFASESEFHFVRDAGKAAKIRLTEILKAGGYLLHDTWWYKNDLDQYGGSKLNRKEFHDLHIQAVSAQAVFDPDTPKTMSTGRADYF